MRELFLGAAIAACSAVGLHASDVAAQEAPGGIQMERIETTQVGQQQVFLVNFLCGVVGGEDDEFLTQGTYLTAINIANLGGSNVNVRVRALESWPVHEGTGPAATLNPALQVRRGRALEIDCLDIFTALKPEDQFFKGFVVITPPQGANLGVVAIYTYGGGTDPIDFGG